MDTRLTRLPFAALGMLTCASAQLQFNFHELRDPAAAVSSKSSARAINDKGTVGGGAAADSGPFVARIWHADGTGAALPGPQGANFTTVFGLNSAGDACGWASDANGDQACQWLNGQFTSLGWPPGFNSTSLATAMNDRGVVAVVGLDARADFGAFLRDANGFTALRQLDSNVLQSGVYGLTEAGDACGVSSVGNQGAVHAVLWLQGEPKDLGDLSGGDDRSGAWALNSHGLVVGYGSRAAGVESPVKWVNGSPVQLVLPNDASGQGTAYAVNEVGQAAGRAYSQSTKNYVPCLWTADGRYINLQAKVGGLAGWKNMACYGLNDKGQVCGEGLYLFDPVQGLYRESAFRFDPVTTVAKPASYTLYYGRVDQGNVASLGQVDGDSLRICKFLVPNGNVDPVQFRVEGNLPFAPMNVWFKVHVRMSVAGAYALSVNLYDWSRGVFDPATNVTGPVTTDWTDFESIAKNDVTRYFRASDRRALALVRLRSNGPTALPGWCAEFDQAAWEIVPNP